MEHQRGTTLLELLVAMTLLALIAIYGLYAVRFFGSLERVERRIERQDLIDAVADHMRAAIAGARAVSLGENADHPQLAFLGTPREVAFVTAADPRLEYGGLSFVRFKRDGQSLVALRHSFRANLTLDHPTTDPILLADNIFQFDLAYYGATADGQTPRWYETWPVAARLPRAVRVTIAYPEANRPLVLTILIETAQQKSGISY